MLVVGLGPVGLAACMLAKAMGAIKVYGVDTVQERIDIAVSKGLVDNAFISDDTVLDKIKALTRGNGVERAVDCSGNTFGRQLAIRATRKWGKIVFIGEGGTVEFNPSPDIIHETVGGEIPYYESWESFRLMSPQEYPQALTGILQKHFLLHMTIPVILLQNLYCSESITIHANNYRHRNSNTFLRQLAKM